MTTWTPGPGEIRCCCGRWYTQHSVFDGLTLASCPGFMPAPSSDRASRVTDAATCPTCGGSAEEMRLRCLQAIERLKGAYATVSDA